MSQQTDSAAFLFSSQEVHIEIRAVNGDVATHAFATGLETQPAMRYRVLFMNSGMALQAQLAPFPPNQKHSIDTAVWIVAGDTSIDFPGRMFVDKRTVLLHVTGRTGLRGRPYQIRSVWRAVRIVTVRALHETFRNAMVHRQSKLRFDRAMTRVAKLGFRGLQQAVAKPAVFVGLRHDLKELRLGSREATFALVLDLIHKMRRVTRVAGHTLRRMLGMIETLL